MNNYIDDDINEEYYDIDQYINNLEDDIDIDDVSTYEDFYNDIIDELRLNEVDRKSYSFKYKDDYINALDNCHYLVIPYWTESDESYKTLIDNKIQEILNSTKLNIRK